MSHVDPCKECRPKWEALEEDFEFQDFVAIVMWRHGLALVNMQSKRHQIAIGENLAGLIEEKKKHATRWVPSGIYCPDNSWMWITGTYDILFVIPRATLIQMHKRGTYRATGRPDTSRGFLVPEPDARAASLKILEGAKLQSLKKQYLKPR